MTDSTHQADALLTEHFQYTPLSLIDEIINAVNTIVYRAVEAIENGLLSIPVKTLGFGVDKSSTGLSIPDTDGDGNVEYPEAITEIEDGVHQLETLLEATVDKTFDRFEIYTLRNILTVPDDLAPWMRLGHYENLSLPLLPNAPTPESILALRLKIRETKKLNLALRRTRSRNTALINNLKALLTPPSTAPVSSANPTEQPPSLSFLTHHPSAQPLHLSFSSTIPAPTPLTTNAQFALSQLPALRARLEELRPRLKTLKGAGGKVDWEGRREERRKYIEGRVRRVVGTGEGEEVGPTPGREDVGSLEGIVQGLGEDVQMEG